MQHISCNPFTTWQAVVSRPFHQHSFTAPVKTCQLAGRDAQRIEYRFVHPSNQISMQSFQIWTKINDDFLILSFTTTQAEYQTLKGVISNILKSIRVGSKRRGHCLMKVVSWNGFELKYPDTYIISEKGWKFLLLLIVVDESHVRLHNDIGSILYSLDTTCNTNLEIYQGLTINQLRKMGVRAPINQNSPNQHEDVEVVDCAAGPFSGKILKHSSRGNICLLYLASVTSDVIRVRIWFTSSSCVGYFNDYHEMCRRDWLVGAAWYV